MISDAPTAATRRRRRARRPRLRFTPDAWAKLRFLRDVGPTEVGGFGITANGDPLLVEDVRLVRQSADEVGVLFDDAAVADDFDDCTEAELPLNRCARIWIHTHPADSASPSRTDEATFDRVFGHCHWAVMMILARGGDRYARLRFGVGPGGSLRIPVRIDWSAPFSASDHDAWEQEYEACVRPLEELSEDAASPIAVMDWTEAIWLEDEPDPFCEELWT